MPLIYQGQKLACSQCIKGHRSGTCNHTSRPLFTIRAKGRPVSQCDHCRELRKTKQVHVKCECASNPSNAPSATAQQVGDTAPEDAVVEVLPKRKGAKKIKTLEPTAADYPNGIARLLEEDKAVQALMQMSTNGDSGDGQDAKPGCECGLGGNCNCCTPRYKPKNPSIGQPSPGFGGSGSGIGPKLSVNIPTSKGGCCNGVGKPLSSPGSLSAASPNFLITPSSDNDAGFYPGTFPNHLHDGGHQVGGSRQEHHQRHTEHFSPYSTEHFRHHRSVSSGGNTPMTPNSPVAPSPMSAMLSPNSALPLHSNGDSLHSNGDSLHPNGHFPNDLDINRPRSSSALSFYSTGPLTPSEGRFDAPPSPSAFENGPDDWPFPNNEVTLTNGINPLFGSGSGSASPVHSMSMEDASMFGFYNQSQDGGSPQGGVGYHTPHNNPASPTRNVNLSPESAYSPARGTGGQASPGGAFTDGLGQLSFEAQAQALTAQGMAVPGHGPTYIGNLSPAMTLEDTFEEDDNANSLPLPGALWTTGHRRRGSIVSVASISSFGRPEISVTEASPYPGPQALPPPSPFNPNSAGPSPLILSSMQLLTVGGCGAQGNEGCHCFTLDGSPMNEADRCGKENCPCCGSVMSTSPSQLGFGGGFNNVPGSAASDLSPTSSSTFASPTEQTPLNANSNMLGTTIANGHYPYGLSPNPVPGLSRSRSSSSSSRLSVSSARSFESSQSNLSTQAGDIAQPTALARANSTGALRQGGAGHQRYRAIRPKNGHAETVPQVTVSQHVKQLPLPTSMSMGQADFGEMGLAHQGAGHSSENLPQFSFGNSPSPSPVSNDVALGLDARLQQQTAPDTMDFYNQFALNDEVSSAFRATTDAFGTGAASSFSMTLDSDTFVQTSPMTSTGGGGHSRTQSASSVFSNSSAASSTSSLHVLQQQPSASNAVSSPYGHNRSRSAADAMHLEVPRPTHIRATSASFLTPSPAGSPNIEFIVTPASPFNGPTS